MALAICRNLILFFETWIKRKYMLPNGTKVERYFLSPFLLTVNQPTIRSFFSSKGVLKFGGDKMKLVIYRRPLF